MGQSDIFEFLEKHPDKWFTTREISNALGVSQGSASVALRALRKKEEIRFMKKDDSGKLIVYSFKEEASRRGETI